MGHDPYPERRRRNRLDEQRHDRREAPTRGPTDDDISRALLAAAEADIPGAPPVGAAKILCHLAPRERTTGNGRRIETVRITHGDPQHGAKRSDDHISRYDIVAPLEQVHHSPDECPECDSQSARYVSHAKHYLAGYEVIECARCEHEIWGESWG